MKTEFDKVWAGIPFVASYGGNKLHDGGMANGPMGTVKVDAIGQPDVP